MSKNEQHAMNPAQRQLYLLNIVRDKKVVDVKEIARQLFVHEATIRRDLNKLENNGLVKRTYGGAVLLEGLDTEIPLYARESANNDKKDIICRTASAMVKDGDTIILDSSSTTSRMIKYLGERRDLKIITNGAKTAILLTQLANATIYCTGGKMRENSLSYIGQTAAEAIYNFYADILFFSCRGLSGRGLSDSNEEEAMLRRVMIKHSRKKVLLIDSTKMNVNSFFHICQTDCIDDIICDQSYTLL